MKWRVFITITGLLLLSMGSVYSQDNLILKDQKARLSYSYGVETADKIKKMFVPLDLEFVIMGLKDAMAGDKLLLTDKEVREALITLQKEITAKSEDQKKAIAEKNKREGEAFLAENKKKEGVITLPSGLQYKVLKEGTGKTPKDTDWVTIHFRGSLIDGTVFEDTRKSFNQPVSFAVKGMVPGWAEGIKLMKEGAKYQLFIPSELAMGERGSGTLIGPNSTLILEIELISVQEKR